MKSKRLLIVLSLLTVISFKSLSAQEIPSPESYFGFKMGEDRKLIDWKQITEYFNLIDRLSPRVLVKTIGKTTLNRPFILVTISSSENIKNIDLYKKIQQQIANPYDLEKTKAENLIEKAKTVVLISMNIHSTEIASSQESVELAYELATSRENEINKILNDVIILLIPSLNPDGLQMVVDWYRKYLNTPYEACRMPWLYHYYAGHDNNRDWFMFNLKESRLTSKILYHEWFPEIVYDQHQMGSTGPRLFLPPYSDPVNLNVSPLLMSEINMLGKHVLSDLHQHGFKGVTSGMSFNAYFEGTMSKTPIWHNMVGILSEAASSRLATPIYLPRGSLGKYGPERARYSTVTNFLDPWEGGWWRLRDIIKYEKCATYSILELASTYRKKFIMNFYKMNREAIQMGKEESPYFYLIPLNQHDPNSASEMLKRLEYNGIKIFRSKREFEYQGITYPQNTFVIPLSQPCRACIKDLMESQIYPNLKSYPNGPPRPPYDFTGWTLPLQMGVSSVEIKKPLNLELVLAEDYGFNEIKDVENTSKYYIIERRYNNCFTILNNLIKKEVEIYWADEDFNEGGKDFPAGTIIIPEQKNIGSLLNELSKKYEVPIYSGREQISIKGSRVSRFRLGVYQPWTASMDEGWTRFVLDSFEFEYKTIHNDIMKSGRLEDFYDVIIIPSMSTATIVDGRYRWRREPVLGSPEMPKKYRGGIGNKGVEALINFIKAGGTLITIDGSSNFAIEKLRIPAVNVVKGLKQGEYYSPGSLLEIELNTSHPLAYGMPKHAAIRSVNSPAFRLLPYSREIYAVGYYTKENPLLSGWLIGGDRLEGNTVLAEIPVEKGRVIIFGFGVQSRAQTHGTFKLLFNAIFTSKTQSVGTLKNITNK